MSFESQYATSYYRSIVTEALSCTTEP